jgi:hypothetical protein
MRVLKQIIQEFWLPFLIALLWTSYRVSPLQADQYIKIIENFVPCFFLASWAISQIMRIKRQHNVEDSFTRLEKRFLELQGTLGRLSTVWGQLQGHTIDLPTSQLATQDISALAANADTSIAAANSAMSEALESLAGVTEKSRLIPGFVWHSTFDSVNSGRFSVLAASEVLLAMTIYWTIVIVVENQSYYLVVGLVVAPLLLLRSDASIAQGVKWLERYVDGGLTDVTDRSMSIFSIRFLLSVALGLIAGGASAFTLGRLWQPQSVTWGFVVEVAIMAYVAAQIGVAGPIAFDPRYVGTIGGNWRLLLAAVSGGAAAVAIGFIASGADFAYAVIAVVVVGSMGVAALLEAPSTVAFLRATRDGERRIDSIEAVGAGLASAPKSFVVFAPAVFFGGWVRTVVIRFAATLLHLRAGILAIPQNWWRALFVIDILYPPELVPGYKRPDFFNLPYFVDRIAHSQRLTEKYVSILGLCILYIPAYFYRLVIKSTCWLYMPLVYIVGRTSLASRPEILNDVLLYDLRERGRRVFSLIIGVGFFVYNLTEYRLPLPAMISSALEYVFAIDEKSLKPLQLLIIVSALTTYGLFAYTGKFRAIVRHSSKDPVLRKPAERALRSIDRILHAIA